MLLRLPLRLPQAEFVGGFSAPKQAPAAPHRTGWSQRRPRGVMEEAMAQKTQAQSAPQILTKEEVLDRLHKGHRHGNTGTFRAMYSSVVGGITREPAAMVVPLDDHMVHRGHAVFDTAVISLGALYELEEHLDRFLRSASLAKIPLAFPREELRAIILATASASGLKEGLVRYWMSVGPGGFSLSPSECTRSSFYVIALEEEQPREICPGIRMITSTVEMKSPLMATAKTNNYLPNALCHIEAEEANVDEALWIDERGCIGEGPNMNVAFVSSEGVLMVPSFERILAGCTVQRVMKLAEKLTVAHHEGSNGIAAPSPSNSSTIGGGKGGEGGGAPLLKSVRFGPVMEAEARSAVEMMLIGSGSQVKPVIEWDRKTVGAGRPGPVATALFKLLQDSYNTRPLTPIPELY